MKYSVIEQQENASNKHLNLLFKIKCMHLQLIQFTYYIATYLIVFLISLSLLCIPVFAYVT